MHQRSRLAYMKNRRIAMIPAVSDAPPSPTPPPPTWSPLDDVGLATWLLLPGDYSPTGAGGTDGRWTDSSGFGRHAESTGGAFFAPPAASGCPVFNGAFHQLIITPSVSLADSINYPGNSICTNADGMLIVIASQVAPNPADAGGSAPYNNPGMVSGSAASPLLAMTDVGGRFSGYSGSAALYDLAYGTSVPAAGSPHIVAGAWDAAGTYAAVDEDAFVGPVAWDPTGVRHLNNGNIGPDTWVGRSFAAHYAGTVYAVAGYPTKSDTKLAQWRAWAVAQGLV